MCQTRPRVVSRLVGWDRQRRQCTDRSPFLGARLRACPIAAAVTAHCHPGLHSTSGSQFGTIRERQQLMRLAPARHDAIRPTARRDLPAGGRDASGIRPWSEVYRARRIERAPQPIP